MKVITTGVEVRHRRSFLALSYYLIAVPCGLAIAPDSAVAQFVPNDRVVSDPNANINNPSYDTISNTMVFQEDSGATWLSKIDPITGNISPQNGQGQLLDSAAAPAQKIGNTADFSYGGGVPYIIYTRLYAGHIGLGEAWQNSSQVWTMQNVANPLARYRPQGTQNDTRGSAAEVYNYVVNGQSLIAWRNVGDANSEGTLSPGPLPQGGRWVDGENAFLVIISVGGVFQVAFVDLSSANPTPVQVTSEPGGVLNMFSWFAPEFNAPAFSVLVGNPPTQLAVYVKTGPATFKKFHEFSLPAPGFPYLSSPEAFVVNGTSYIFVVAASSLGIGNFPFQPNGPSQVWIAGINPANPFFRRIDDPTQIAVKAEPEVYFTAGGPTIYFQQRGPGDSGNLVIHAADTGLGTDWNYDNQAYSGPWAAAFRDGKNCSCTPFPIGDRYQEVSIFPSLPNRQQARQVMGPEGNLYAPVVHDQSGRAGSVVAFSANSTQTFQVNESDAGSGLQIGNGLVASNGDFLVGGNSNLIRYTSSGMKLWTSPIRGTPTGLKFTPEGNVLALTLNGWFQVFDPGSGRLIREVNVTPPNRKGATTACLAQGEQGNVKGERKGEEKREEEESKISSCPYSLLRRSTRSIRAFLPVTRTERATR